LKESASNLVSGECYRADGTLKILLVWFLMCLFQVMM